MLAEEVYNKRRLLYTSIQAYVSGFDAHTFKGNVIKAQLDLHFSYKYAPSKAVFIIRYNIPVWQAAAVVICFFLGAIWYVKSNTRKNTEPTLLTSLTDTVYIRQPSAIVRDTLYIIKTIKEKHTAFLRTEVAITDTAQRQIIDLLSSENRGDMHIAGFTDQQPQGQTLEEDTIAERFMVRM